MSGLVPERNEFVASDYRYAGFWIRFFAFILDTIIVSFFAVGIAILLAFFALTGGSLDAESGASLGNLVGILTAWLYQACMESSDYRATFGKMAMGIFVTDGDGNKLTFFRATARHFAKILNMFTLCIGFIMIAFTKKKQGLHDMVTDCVVLRKP